MTNHQASFPFKDCFEERRDTSPLAVANRRLHPIFEMVQYSCLFEKNTKNMAVSGLSNRIGNGWQVQELKKECNLRFFCGGWYSQNLILLTDQTFHVGPLDDSQKCTYRRLSGIY